MPIIRVVKDKDNPYVQINKKAPMDKNLSLKAKGLHYYLMCMPDDWKIYISELVKHFTDGRVAVGAALKELIEKDYAKRTRTRHKGGKFSGFDYEVFENPTSARVHNSAPKQGIQPKAGFPSTEKPKTEKPFTENRPLLNNNSTNKESNRELIKDIIGFLNARAGTNFRHTTESTVRSIAARFRDGYTVAHFKDVIAKKCREWMGTDFQKYLCPTTLFRPGNFEKYLNQKESLAKIGKNEQAVQNFLNRNSA